MDFVIRIVFAILFIIVICGVVHVTTRHKGEKKQGDLNDDIQDEAAVQKEPLSKATNTPAMTDYLLDHAVNTKAFAGHDTVYRRQFVVCRRDNLPITGTTFEEDLYNWQADIDSQIAADKEWEAYLSDENRAMVAEHHAAWRIMLAEIDDMLKWSPGR